MITYPNCKINLGLHVVVKRSDGYHDVETIFLPVHDLCDELEIVEGALSMVQDGIVLDNAPEDNLCMKAWKLLHEEFGIPPVSIRLKKNIPFGAGLGGGSSDAAFTLKMLNEMFSLCLGDSDLERLAARLGADCAFFIRNQPAYATGIGDQLELIKLDLSAYRIVIEIPEGEHVSTKEAYAGLGNAGILPRQPQAAATPSTLEGEPDSTNRVSLNSPSKIEGVSAVGGRGRMTPRPDLRDAVKRPVSEWRDFIVNDFETSVFPAHLAIADLKDDMYRRGALYASMTGSGAAVFGIFKA